THSVLAQAFDTFRTTRALPINLRERIEAQLPSAIYDTIDARDADVEKVLGWVHHALAAFDGAAKVRAVERTFEYVFHGTDSTPAFVLRATVDLVVEHPSGEIEHIDWKTGASTYPDMIQTITSRIVVGQAYPAQPIRTTTMYLAAGTTESGILTRDEVRETWENIKTIVTGIQRDQDWLPSSNPLCPYCPFYQNGCSLYTKADTTDVMTEWLEEKFTIAAD
ncbi:MAG: PD-(D/E)XK nuclease family protein, partial [Chloroflexota bacterium]|nr:PD-(D/E)XK nuclease family protein [Chloroflexota bacterium]